MIQRAMLLACLLVCAACAGGGTTAVDAGVEVDAGCPAGTTRCDGLCTDTDTDSRHCGTCDNECGAGQTCDGAGSCVLSCPPDLLACGGTCVDPDTDRMYCGASGDCVGGNAGEACADGFVCDGAGACTLSCQAGLLECGGTCVDPASNPDYCGATDCAGGSAGEACADDEACVDSACVSVCTGAGCIPATCTDIHVTSFAMWGEPNAAGFDLRAWTNSTLHFLGCNNDGCNPADVYCNHDPLAETLQFGVSAGTLRAAVDPDNALGDTMPTTYDDCCTGPLGLCNAFDSNSNGSGVDAVDALCWALGYADGEILREEISNYCPEVHSTTPDGLTWTSDWVQSDGYGSEYRCTGFRF